MEATVAYRAVLENDTGRAFRGMVNDGRRAFRQLDDAQEDTRQSAKKTKGAFSGIFDQVKALGIYGAIESAASAAKDVLVDLGRQAIDVTAEFQKYKAVLTTALGSNSAAVDSMELIQAFAAKTPFSVRELTDSFVKLVNQGFEPTQDELRKLGDLAASTGKSFDQLAEAVLDAQTGEFERLKEFGIKARKEGDKIAFSFKGQTATVANTDKAIRNYILTLGNLEGVSGSMAAISDTLGGKISNLGDNFDRFLLTIGTKADPIFSAGIKNMSELIGMVTDILDPASKLKRELDGTLSESDILTNNIAPKLTQYDKLYAGIKKLNDAQKEQFVSLGNEIANTMPLAVRGYEKITIGAKEYTRAVIDTQFATEEIGRKTLSAGKARESEIKKLNADLLKVQVEYKKVAELQESGYVMAEVRTPRSSQMKRLPIAGNENNIYVQRAKQELNNEAKKLIAEQEAIRLRINKVSGLTDPKKIDAANGGGKPTTDSSLKAGIAGVAGDAKLTRNVIINIDKQIENYSPEFMNVAQSETDLRTKLRTLLAELINDANIVAGN